jgi:hypothetical protein
MSFSTLQEGTDNRSIRELHDETKKLRKATEFSSCVMIGLTVVLVFLTGVLILEAFKN